MERVLRRLLAMLTLAVLPTACKRDPAPQGGDVPPPIVSVRPGLCTQGGGVVADSVARQYLPRMVQGYCIDPNGEIRTYGKQATGSLEQVCTELFDGECEVYRHYGLQRVVAARYVDGGGSPGSVNVNVSRFDTMEGAFAFFSRRVVADSDPAKLTTKALKAGTLGALGSGVAYLWRGEHVAELSYANELQAPDALKRSAAIILPPIAAAIGDKLPGPRRLPAAAELLPDKDRLPLGLEYETGDALGIAGVGPGAFGSYQSGSQRYRLVSLVRPNEASAQDVIRTLRRLPGTKESKGPPPNLTITVRSDEESPKTEWVIGRAGAVVVGVGDDGSALTSPGSDEKSTTSLELSTEQKFDRLRTLLSEIEQHSRSIRAQ